MRVTVRVIRLVMEVKDQVVLVTGASSGLGFALAKQLHEAGARLVLTGRRTERLQQLQRLCPGSAVVLADLARLPERERLAEEALQAHGSLSILVNCAGYPSVGATETLSWEEITHGLTVNLAAPIHLSSLLLPALLQQTPSKIVNINSLSARVAIPTQNVYAASKAGLSSFGKTVQREFRGRGLSVLNVYPGAHDTEMNPRDIREQVQASHGVVLHAQRCEKAARLVLSAIRRDRRALYVTTWQERVLAFAESYTPGLVDLLVAKLGPSIELFSRLIRERFAATEQARSVPPASSEEERVSPEVRAGADAPGL